MIVTELTWQHCRNLTGGAIAPAAGVNVICGDNAQGKTNLLELLWIYTGGRSFRGARDGELIELNRMRAASRMTFTAGGRSQTAEIALYDGRRHCTLNGVAKKNAAAMVGAFCAVVFAPVHLALVRGGPAERRRFLDAAICQANPSYAARLTQYQRALEQRNALLKAYYHHPSMQDTLPEWDDTLARLASDVTTARRAYLQRLQPAAQQTYYGISSEREQLTMTYDAAGWTADNYSADAYRAALDRARKDDLGAGFTTVGPHRDDIDIAINGLPARTYGSQGQQRSAVLALKLGEAAVLGKAIGEAPVILLDDVLSELDGARQDYLLNQMGDRQVFITCCEISPVLRMRGGQAFRMAGGDLTVMQPG